MKITFTDCTKPGNPTSVMEINDPELDRILAEAQAEWAALKEAGTPYWCIHEGRSVTHRRAYWRDDEPDNPIHRKHGVFCRDCGGYIQEG